jgi:kynurenine 3-monooxygenase
MKNNDSSSKIKNIAIVGAGLVGSVMACYLSRRGYVVDMFERRNDPRIINRDSGRSINLALSDRGWKALSEIGLEEEVSKLIIPMPGRMMHSETGDLTFQPYGREGEAINSVSRGGLNQLLLTKAESQGIRMHFNHAVTDINFEEGIVCFENGETFHADIILGADGAYSMLRYHMQRTERFNYSQHFIEYGYKELSIPSGPDGKHQIEINALHIWPRGKFMLIALPNLDGSFTCTLFLAFEGEESFANLKSDTQIMDFFSRHFPDAQALIPSLVTEFRENPTSDLVTIRCFPWSHGKVLLIGDASHGVVPFYGQGMNSGFEDCRVLNDFLNEYNDDWNTVIPLFQNHRKPDADAIADLALGNFLEMRDLVADENFLLRKKIEARLYEKYPGQWIPLYSMVTFHEDIRYSEAQLKGRIQQEIMNDVMKDPHIKDSWDRMELSPIIAQLQQRLKEIPLRTTPRG